ncbi:MAG: DUF2971 domain-containing protein [Patescibacteria group bacterium]
MQHANKQIYYHFLSSQNAIHDLERKMIRVSTIDSLNDPFELLPYLRHMRNKEYGRYMDIRNRVSKIYGLLCFSTKTTEPLLWSHYANKHKGVALGFELLNSDVFEVDYDPNPIRRQIVLTQDLFRNKSMFLDLAKIKYEKWKYEQESRMIVKLDECVNIDGHYFMEFNNRLIVRQIKLGAFYDNSDRYIAKLASDFSAEIIVCRLERQGYRIIKNGKKTKIIQEEVKRLSTINSN